MKNFIRWQVVFGLICIALGLFYMTGIPALLIAADSTFISMFGLFFFLLGSLFTGFSLWKYGRNSEYQINYKLIKYFEISCPLVGLIAAVIGFILLFTGTGAFTFEVAKPGLFTSLSGTAIGLIGAFLLKTQNLFLPEKKK